MIGRAVAADIDLKIAAGLSVDADALIVLFVNHLLQKVQRLALGALDDAKAVAPATRQGALRGECHWTAATSC